MIIQSSPAASATLYDSIVVGNSGSDVSVIGNGTVSGASAYNLIGTVASGVGLANGANGNQVGVSDPGLSATLADNGGPTQSLALLPGSPALDRGSAAIVGVTVPTTDQRGALRGPAGLNGGAAVDIGAYEASSSYLVTSTADSGDVGTLRAAVGWANVSANANPANLLSADPNTVVFDTGGAFATPQTITLTGGTLGLTNTNAAESVVGPGANLLTVNGNYAVGVFQVQDGVTATLSGLIVAGGSAAAGAGIDNSGTLTVDHVAVTQNSATNGGGIANEVSGVVTVTGSSVTANAATGAGGGIEGCQPHPCENLR